MLYRLDRLFNVSRRRAAVAAILCVIGSILIELTLPALTIISGGLLIYAAIYGSVWFYKYNRDQGTARIAQLEAQQAPVKQVAEPVIEPVTEPVIEEVNSANYRLIVHPPLDRL